MSSDQDTIHVVSTVVRRLDRRVYMFNQNE